MKKSLKIIIGLIIILIICVIAVYTYDESNTNQIGSNNQGYVTKTVYNPLGTKATIVVITGIHPREKLAINPEIESAKKFASNHNDVKIINYNVTVTKDADIYNNSRYNGEHLINKYVVPDLNKTDADVVIISHSHIEGYGSGYYIATPAMDSASVSLAQSIKEKGNHFNYYPTQNTSKYKSTSIELTSKPIAEEGHPTLVYEIPENITEEDSTNRTYDLIDISCKIITNEV